MKYTVNEFAKEIRKLYPGDYDDLSDEKLVELWLKKYPNDKEKIEKKNKSVFSILKGAFIGFCVLLGIIFIITDLVQNSSENNRSSSAQSENYSQNNNDFEPELSLKGKLTRSMAEKLIVNKLQIPKDQYVFFDKYEEKTIRHYQVYNEDFGDYKKGDRQYFYNTENFSKSDFFSQLESQGLITLNEKTTERHDGEYHYRSTTTQYAEVTFFVASPTPNSLQYFKGDSVKIATIEFVEVTGIREFKESNSADVEFSLIKTKITPFGQAYKNNYWIDPYEIEEKHYAFACKFLLYDDGWRIGNITPLD